MTEAELIKKIQILNQIEPRKDWVDFTKKSLFGQKEESRWDAIFSVFPRLFPALKPAFAIVGIALIFVVTSSFAQNALPGDFLYSFKKLTEKSQTIFLSETERPKVQLELTNKRLEELAKIAQTNQTQKLAPAINEFQASTVEAAKNLTKVAKSEKNPKIVKEVVFQTQKLEEQKKNIEALGIVVGESEELNSALKELVEGEIKDIENRSLSQEQKKILESAKSDFESGEYSEALTKIIALSQQ
jgi:hypothetical protein